MFKQMEIEQDDLGEYDYDIREYSLLFDEANKNELIRMIAYENNLYQIEVREHLNLILDAIKRLILGGVRITFADFGVFTLAKHQPRAFTMPQLKEKVRKPAHYAPVLRFSYTFKKKVAKIPMEEESPESIENC